MAVQSKDSSTLFSIDPLNLYNEWLDQANRFFKAATSLAAARAEHEQAKAARDVVEAELSKNIRTNPSAYGVNKVTDKSVEQTVVLQPKYISANQDVLEKKHKVDLCQARVDAYEHRKKALENLTFMETLGLGHSGSPRPRNKATREMVDETRGRRDAVEFDTRVRKRVNNSG